MLYLNAPWKYTAISIFPSFVQILIAEELYYSIFHAKFDFFLCFVSSLQANTEFKNQVSVVVSAVAGLAVQ